MLVPSSVRSQHLAVGARGCQQDTPGSTAGRCQKRFPRGGIIPTRWARDALHVALASVSRSDFIAGWNFKHIVHLEKIPRYNAVNTLEGYPAIAIYSPREVLAYEEEDV